MCLFPKFIINKAYSKQKYLTIGCTNDERKKYVPVGCGHCYECKKQKAQQWRVRLYEEMKIQKYAYFVTLTFSPEELNKLCKETNTKEDCNAIASIAVRRFLERWRKTYKKSLKHWLITELGHKNTERIHIHGILFPPEEMDILKLTKFWKYGKCDIGQYCTLQTVNYIVKYVTKIDADHKQYEPIILCSPGIGANFVNTEAAKKTYKYRPHNSAEYYRLNNGRKVALPIYYRNKLYTEKERQNLWTDRLDEHTIYINGIKIRNINTLEGASAYYNLLASMQEWNDNLGYGNRSEEWKKKPYNITFKMLNGLK